MRPDVFLWRRRADIFLNTTIADNQPLSVLESMASGTPNVGFSTGGIPEVVETNSDGFLIDKDEVNLLSEKIISIFHTKE